MKSKILLIFAFQSSCLQEAHKKEVLHFLLKTPEIKLIADYDIKFIFFAPGLTGWKHIVDVVYSNYSDYFGVILFVDIDRVLFLSNIISFVFQSLNKAIVFTGAKQNLLVNSVDAKSNLINSFQIASIPIQEVCLVFGSRVLRPSRSFISRDSQYNLFSATEDGLIGKIDFGFTPISMKQSSRNSKMIFAPNINDRISHLNLYPFTNLEVLTCGVGDGALIQGGIIDNQATEAIHKCCDRVVLFDTQGHRQCDQCINIEKCQLEAAVSKLMWSLGQTHDLKKFRNLFKANLTGEWGYSL